MPQRCSIVSGLPALLAQLLLFGIAVGGLAYKRSVEHPRRPWGVWAFDVTKQFISTVAAHLCGMTIAYVVEAAGTQHLVSQCAWYLVAFCFDTTLGTAVAVGLHTLALRGALRLSSIRKGGGRVQWLASAVAHCGDYGTPPRWQLFLPQLAEWTFAVILARFVCGVSIYLLKGWLVYIARVVDAVFGAHTVLELFFVMVLMPILLNLIQAFLQDTVLKYKAKLAGGQGPADKAGDFAEPQPGQAEEPAEAVELVRLKQEPPSALV